MESSKRPGGLVSSVTQELTARRFVAVWLAIVAVMLAATAAINWTVNPYGQYSTDLIAPIVQDSRGEKLALFDKWNDPPEGLILGSSRALKFEPSYLQQKTNLKFFNFAVNHGRPEDFLAILRLYRQKFHSLPKMIVVGVDTASLNDVVPEDARLNATPRLFEHVPDVCNWDEQLNHYFRLLSFQQLSASMKSVAKRIRRANQKSAPEYFEPDGLIRYAVREAEMANGTYDFEAALRYNEREFTSIFGAFSDLSDKRLAYIDEAIRLCSENDCKVFVFSTVSHPRLRSTLGAKTKFVTIENRAIGQLREISNKYNATFYDFSSVDNFRGDPAQFVDGIHPLENNTRLMIDQLLSGSDGGEHAIQ